MKSALVGVLVLLLGLGSGLAPAAWAEPAECGDAIDNDADGLTDYPDDPGCLDATDDTESSPTPECSDGVDNDGDGETDFPADTACTDQHDTAEGYSCPGTYSSYAASGSTSCFYTSVTIRFNRDRHAFSGALAVARRECVRDAEVILRQRRPGKDRVLASVLSSRRGRWRVPMGGPFRGRFYADAVGRVLTSESGAEVVCPGDRSVTIRVRARG